MIHFSRSLFALPVLALAVAPASAKEVFGGVYKHGVNTPFTIDIDEKGADFELGLRGNRIAGLGFIGGPAPYIFGSLNSRGDTSLAAAGLAWKIGGPVYVRPGIGIAVHTGRPIGSAPNIAPISAAGSCSSPRSRSASRSRRASPPRRVGSISATRPCSGNRIPGST